MQLNTDNKYIPLEDDALSNRYAGGSEQVTLKFEDIVVQLQKKDILKQVYGCVKPGQTLAIMGPSGAGKTTLLNAISGRVEITSGHVTLNGEPLNRKWQRKMAYVLQQDAFYPQLTLRETLTFAALLRLPGKMPHDLKMARIDEVVDVLQLNSCLDTTMGGLFVGGLSGGERKRAGIACEMLSSPPLLFLDEPTSGLDSAIAHSLMLTLDDYSRSSKKVVVSTIHQPSSQIFHLFTNLLLIVDGQVAYYGRGNKVVEYFSDLGMHCSPHYNPADFILEEVTSGSENVRKLIEAASNLRLKSMTDDVEISSSDTSLSSSSYSDSGVQYGTFGENGANFHVKRPSGTLRLVDVDSYVNQEAEYQTNFFLQYMTLTKRNLRRQKDRYLSAVWLIQVLVITTAMGIVWFQLPRTEETARDRFGLLHFLNTSAMFMVIGFGLTAFADEEGVIWRERSAGIHRLSAYYLAVATSELPSLIVMETLYFIIVYWMSNLMPTAWHCLGTWLLLMLLMIPAQAVGMVASIAISNRVHALTTVHCLTVVWLLSNGFLNTNMRFSWLIYTSLLTYSVTPAVTFEFSRDYAWMFGCDPSSTLFATECTENSTRIDGDLIMENWQLLQIPIYGCCLVLVAVATVCHTAAYLILKYIRCPHTA